MRPWGPKAAAGNHFWGFWVQFCAPGVPKGAAGSHFGGLGGALGGPRGALGGHFGGLGVPLGAFGRQSTPKTAALFPRRSILSDFSAQMDPNRQPKLSKKRSKIHSKIYRKIDWVFDWFRKRFWLKFELCLAPWTLENELLV